MRVRLDIGIVEIYTGEFKTYYSAIAEQSRYEQFHANFNEFDSAERFIRRYNYARSFVFYPNGNPINNLGFGDIDEFLDAAKTYSVRIEPIAKRLNEIKTEKESLLDSIERLK